MCFDFVEQIAQIESTLKAWSLFVGIVKIMIKYDKLDDNQPYGMARFPSENFSTECDKVIISYTVEIPRKFSFQ